MKETCIELDQVIISCMSGICKNVSDVYSCTYKSKLEDLETDREGRGSCNCAVCTEDKPKMSKYEGECIDNVDICYGTDDHSSFNETMQQICRTQPCYTCKDVSNTNIPLQGL